MYDKIKEDYETSRRIGDRETERDRDKKSQRQ